MDPVQPDSHSHSHSPCPFPGPAATTCPGYRAAPLASMPDHLRYLPFVNQSSSEVGCGHLVAVPTRRGGFRAGCGHPAGNPAHWSDAGLVGRRTPLVQRRRAFAR